MEAIWSTLTLFLFLLYFTSYIPHFLRVLIRRDGVNQRREGCKRAAEKERMERESKQGGGQVILESQNSNHHLQLLPPRCSNWTSTERGRSSAGK